MVVFSNKTILVPARHYLRGIYEILNFIFSESEPLL